MPESFGSDTAVSILGEIQRRMLGIEQIQHESARDISAIREMYHSLDKQLVAISSKEHGSQIIAMDLEITNLKQSRDRLWGGLMACQVIWAVVVWLVSHWK